MADAPRKTFDAVLIPASYPPGKVAYDKLAALAEEFGPALGCNRVYQRTVGDRAVLTPDHSSLLFPKGHTLAGQERFEWADRGDGVMYGLKKPDADAATPAERQKSRADSLSSRKAAAFGRRDELAAVPQKDRTADQAAELARLERFLPLMYPDGRDNPSPAPHAPSPVKV